MVLIGRLKLRDRNNILYDFYSRRPKLSVDNGTVGTAKQVSSKLLFAVYHFIMELYYRNKYKRVNKFMSRTYLLTLTSVSTFFFFSCTSDEIGSSKDVNPEAVFFDYEIWAEEGKEDVTVNVQYRMGGKNGTTLVLDDPSKVLLDGEQLTVDSAKVTGAYYEIQRPVESFSGKHSITFIDVNRKEYREEFEFRPFSLDPDVPATLNRGDLLFNFKGLDSIDYLNVILTDTSFNSADINDIDTVKNGRLVISAHRLSALVNGPINLQFHREVEKPMKNGTKEGGKLYIHYGLKREFELKAGANL
jgi:hypothetical protein